MAFHPDKCNVISVTRNKKPIEFDYTLHEHTLDHVTKVEYLGVIISLRPQVGITHKQHN
jgi:hypothetical protein